MPESWIGLLVALGCGVGELAAARLSGRSVLLNATDRAPRVAQAALIRLR